MSEVAQQNRQKKGGYTKSVSALDWDERGKKHWGTGVQGWRLEVNSHNTDRKWPTYPQKDPSLP